MGRLAFPGWLGAISLFQSPPGGLILLLMVGLASSLEFLWAVAVVFFGVEEGGSKARGPMDLELGRPNHPKAAGPAFEADLLPDEVGASFGPLVA